MQEKIKSEGKCLFCRKTFAKAGINRHLSTHIKEKEKSGKPGQSFFVKVETSKRWGSTPYFLSLWIDGETTLQDLDNFLRNIWLDCCGHLSAFRDPSGRINGILYDKDEDEMDEDFEDEDDDDEEDDDVFGSLFGYQREDDISKKCKAGKIFFIGLVMDYEYDFGSTTELRITVMDEYSVKADEDIVLLSRNEPLKIICSICGKVPATQMCPYCIYEEGAEFCDQCAKKHAKKCEDFDEDSSMPIVNSPRSGVCGYTGGIIDIERDTYQV